MPKMSEGNKQEQAALDSIKELRKKRKKRPPSPRQREAQHRGYGGSNDSVDKMMYDEDAPRREKAEADLFKTKGMKCGGKVHKMKSGGKVRGSGCCKRVKKCKMY